MIGIGIQLEADLLAMRARLGSDDGAAPGQGSADVAEAMAQSSIRWTDLNVRGDVADQLERVAKALAEDVIIVGKSTRRRLGLTSSVARRLLSTTPHCRRHMKVGYQFDGGSLAGKESRPQSSIIASA